MENFHAHVLKNSAYRLRGLLALCDDALNTAQQEFSEPRFRAEASSLEKIQAGVRASLELVENDILPMAAEMEIVEENESENRNDKLGLRAQR